MKTQLKFMALALIVMASNVQAITFAGANQKGLQAYNFAKRKANEGLEVLKKNKKEVAIGSVCTLTALAITLYIVKLNRDLVSMGVNLKEKNGIINNLENLHGAAIWNKNYKNPVQDQNLQVKSSNTINSFAQAMVNNINQAMVNNINEAKFKSGQFNKSFIQFGKKAAEMNSKNLNLTLKNNKFN